MWRRLIEMIHDLGGQPSRRRWRVFVVSSGGGVLLDLLAMRPWLQRHDATWVAPRGPDTNVLLRDERWQPELHSSSLARLPFDIVRAVTVLRAERADCVISAGSGVAFSWFVAAALLGVPRVWVDTFNFVERPGRVARWCGRLADVVLTQRASTDPSRRRSVTVGLLY